MFKIYLGKAGLKSEKGFTGDNGDQGIKGIIGDKGRDGMDGAKGNVRKNILLDLVCLLI